MKYSTGNTLGATKTFLVTGGAGFIGSHLVDTLLEAGHRVLVIDNLSTGKLENIAHHLGHANFHFARAEITDQIVLDRLTSQADIVVHLAAAVGVQLIVDHPVHTIETNVMGTEAVLKTSLRYGCRVIIASTSEVYGKGSKIPFCEDDDVLLGATNKSRWGYAASKMLDEFLGFSYQREFDLDVVLIRLFNTVGPRQTGQYGMVIPRFVEQALHGKNITVFGDGTQSRCFCDVRDVVRAILGLSLNAEAAAQLFNIGNDEEISILELAKKIKTKTGLLSEIVHIPYSQAYSPGFEDMRRRVPSLERIGTLLGWQPRFSLDEILNNIIEYEKTRLNGDARKA